MPSLDEWRALARNHGAKSVMSLDITEAELEAETQRQIRELAPLISGVLRPSDKTALDFGCGAGRFTMMLGHLVGHVWGYDPCGDLVGLNRGVPGFLSCPVERFFAMGRTFDVVFVWLVLGGIADLELDAFAERLKTLVAPGGLLIIGDHTNPPGRPTWWHFRPKETYLGLFPQLQVVGEVMQLKNSVTVFAGR